MTEAFGCVANTIKLRSGSYFDFENGNVSVKLESRLP